MQIKQQILKLHNQMEEVTLISKVQSNQYKSVIVELDEFTEEDLKGLLEWLENVYNKEYSNVYKIWRLLSKEIWIHFQKTDFSGEEVILLRKAQKALRVVWHKPFRSKEQLTRIASKHHPIKKREFR